MLKLFDVLWNVYSFLGTTVGLITFKQAISIKKALEKEKLEKKFKSKSDMLTNLLNVFIAQLSNNDYAPLVMNEIYNTVLDVEIYAKASDWGNQEKRLIRRTNRMIHNLITEKYSNKLLLKNKTEHQIIKQIICNLIKIKSILEKEQTIL